MQPYLKAPKLTNSHVFDSSSYIRILSRMKRDSPDNSKFMNSKSALPRYVIITFISSRRFDDATANGMCSITRGTT